jgi:hypothetical protein
MRAVRAVSTAKSVDEIAAERLWVARTAGAID